MDSKEMVQNIQKLMPEGQQKAFWDWVLKNGEEFWATGVDAFYKRAAFMKSLDFKPMIKSCYYNAQRIAIDNPKAKYYEGYATSEIGLPLEHSWVVIDGIIFDPTWEHGRDYFGVHIPTDFIGKFWVKTGMSENLLGRFFIDEWASHDEGFARSIKLKGGNHARVTKNGERRQRGNIHVPAVVHKGHQAEHERRAEAGPAEEDFRAESGSAVHARNGHKEEGHP
jgi:hypothetical protein